MKILGNVEIVLVAGGLRCVCTSKREYYDPPHGDHRGMVDAAHIIPPHCFDEACKHVVFNWQGEANSREECIKQCCIGIASVCWIYGAGQSGDC